MIACNYIPTNQENWPNAFPHMALYWANVLAIVPTLGQFFWFVGMYLIVSQLILYIVLLMLKKRASLIYIIFMWVLAIQ